MRYLSIELSTKCLSILLCDTAKSFSVGEAKVIPLPAELTGNILSPPTFAAEFIAGQLKSPELHNLPVSVMLDVEQVISVAFSHMPAKPDKIRGLANLFAESSLPRTGEEYSVSYSMRDYLHPDGQNRSILYGASSDLIRKFYLALKKAGVNVYSIEPSGAAFSRSVQSYAAATQVEDSNAADVFIDFGQTSSLVTVCRNRQIVFEQGFSSIYKDVIDTYLDVTGGTPEEAAFFFSQQGIDPQAEIYTRYPDLLRRMEILVDVTLDEIFRTLRIVFSGERLETGMLYITGSFTAMPGFNERLSYDSVGFVAQDKIRLGRNTRLTGALPPKTNATENLLYTYFHRRKRSNQTFVVGIILMLLIITIFPIQYLLIYLPAKSDLNTLQSQISDTRYDEVKSLLNEKQRLEGLKQNLATALQMVPTEQQSKVEEIITTLYNQMLPYVSSLAVDLDNTTGALTVRFTTHSFDSFIAMKGNIENAGYFTINPTFSCTVGATGECSGSVNMNVNQFTPFKVADPQTTSSEEVNP